MKTAEANGESRILVSLVEKSLRGQIEKGLLPAGSTLPTFRRLADTHNVSLATVQQAVKRLEKDGLVEVYQGRGAIVRGESMVWSPRVINNRVPGQGKQIGVFLNSLYRGYTSQLLPEYMHGISDELHNWNISLILNIIPDEPSEVLDYCMEKLHSGNASGFILWGINKKTDLVIRQTLQKMRLPFVLFNVKDPEILKSDFRYVAADEKGGVKEAVDFLIKLGHRHIGYIGNTQILEQKRSIRYQAYLDALQENGIPPRQEWTYFFSDWGTDMINPEKLLTGKERPSAIFCDSDFKASAIIRGAQNAGLSIPENFSVIGFDDAPIAAQIQPPLTTIYKPRYEMGREAARILAYLLNNRDTIVPSRKVLKTYLVHRDSCASLNKIMAG